MESFCYTTLCQRTDIVPLCFFCTIFSVITSTPYINTCYVDRIRPTLNFSFEPFAIFAIKLNFFF